LGQDKTADASRLLLSHLTDRRVGVRWLTRAVLSGRDDAALSDLPKSERRRICLAGLIPTTPSEFVP
jgi:hypothetical protein